MKSTSPPTKKSKESLSTAEPITWCPGCPNFMILESVKQTIADSKYKQIDFAITTDIGCHAKIFDYLNLSGIYCLHGRALPTAIGMHIGNPKLKTITFAGDGAEYSEGISHFIHAFKYNPDTTLIVHDNQAFSLTTGQPTATSQQCYIAKSMPKGNMDKPLNPIKLALASNATFIARTHALDIKHTKEILEKAIAHKGFSFVEIIQDCLIFNKDANTLHKNLYKIADCHNKQRAEKYAEEWDYENKNGKVPVGVIYQEQLAEEKRTKTLAEKWGIE